MYIKSGTKRFFDMGTERSIEDCLHSNVKSVSEVGGYIICLNSKENGNVFVSSKTLMYQETAFSSNNDVSQEPLHHIQIFFFFHLKRTHLM